MNSHPVKTEYFYFLTQYKMGFDINLRNLIYQQNNNDYDKRFLHEMLLVLNGYNNTKNKSYGALK